MDKSTAKGLLRETGLRVTAPRLAVLQVLSDATRPLSHGEVLSKIGDNDWDPATIYRNLVKLRDAGLATVVSRAEGIDRYELTMPDGESHRHPHFVCDDCGQVACLPIELAPAISLEGRWAHSIETAVLQLRGECPDCIDRSRGRTV